MKTIPLTPGQTSRFSFDNNGLRYTTLLSFNTRAGVWMASISYEGAPLVTGVPMVIGTELFQGDAVPNLPRGLFLVPVGASNSADAGYQELGDRVKLVEFEDGDEIDVPTI